MEVRLLGTGGRDGWPQPGCRCASCRRAQAAGGGAPGRVLADGLLEIAADQPPAWLQPAARPPAPASAYRVSAVPGGWEVTAPGDERLLIAAGPGAVPRPSGGAAPYDIALLDLLGDPAQLGDLRRRRLVAKDTVVAALYADHRITSAAELDRRCQFWRVLPPADGMVVASAGARRDTSARAAVTGGATEGPISPAADSRGRILVLGGARSGKSTEAELRLAADPHVTYVAAGPWVSDPQAGPAQAGEAHADQAPAGETQAGETWIGPDGSPDEEWARRVAAHRAGRPPWWRTVESADVAGILRSESGSLLIDGIGTWLAMVLDESGIWALEQEGAGPLAEAEDKIAGSVADLVAAWRQSAAHVVAVSDQVGSGVVPATRAGRIFRDQLGWLNQRLAAESEQTVLVVAGRATILPT